jgi:hypothetical protein
MKKRAFRPQEPESPSYPPLGEVGRSAVKRWGLVGLLMGGAACSPAKADIPPPGVPPSQRAENKADAKSSPDAGVRQAESPIPLGGKPTLPRVEKSTQNSAAGDKGKGADKKGRKTGKGKGKSGSAGKTGQDKPTVDKPGVDKPGVGKPNSKPPRPEGLSGKMRAPRPDDKESW